MRVALINYTRFPSPTPGLASLVGTLRKEGHDVALIDLTFVPGAGAQEYVLRELRKVSSDAIGISTGFDSQEVPVLIGDIRQHLGDLPLLIGGVWPTYNPQSYPQDALEHLRQNNGNLWTFAGEADGAVVQFLRDFEAGHPPAGKHIIGAPQDLNALATPDYTLFDMPRYFKVTPCGGAYLPIYASKGCPYSCSFCTWKDRPYQHKEPRLVLEEIRIQESRHLKDGLKSLYFYDPLFGFVRPRFFEMMDLFHRDRLGERLPWFCTTRPEVVTKGWARAAAKGGCHVVSFGLESGLEWVRRDILKKNFTNRQFRQAVRNLKEAGILPYITLMTAVPGTTFWHDLYSVLFTQSCLPLDIAISHYYPSRRTALGEACLRRRETEPERILPAVKRKLTLVLKLLNYPPFIVRGLTHYRLSYLQAYLGFLLNLNGVRTFPIWHPFTRSILGTNSIVGTLWREEYLGARKGRRDAWGCGSPFGDSTSPCMKKGHPVDEVEDAR